MTEIKIFTYDYKNKNLYEVKDQNEFEKLEER